MHNQFSNKVNEAADTIVELYDPTQLERVLKTQYDARLSVGRRWLVWDEDNGLWVVYEQKRYKQVSTVYVSNNLQYALQRLIEED